MELSPFFSGVPDSRNDRSFLKSNEGGNTKEKKDVVHTNGFSSDLDRKVSSHPDITKIIEDNAGETLESFEILNTDRSVGAMLSGDIARAYGNYGFRGAINVHFTGSAGQSFGAFNVPGLKIRLMGEANDYVGKGMNGGEIVVVPTNNAGFVSSDSSIVGNACLYGATGGDFHANGRAGERFGVRNSGAYAVVEGTGDHCCEYMTGGVVVVLGTVGRNVGAGMTGGIGYFYDDNTKYGKNYFKDRVNNEIVKVQRVVTADGELQLRSIVERHFEKTGSEKAEMILNNWENEVGKFWQVYPPSEAKSSVIKEAMVVDQLRISASAPDESVCFLPVGGDLTEDQTARCAD